MYDDIRLLKLPEEKFEETVYQKFKNTPLKIPIEKRVKIFRQIVIRRTIISIIGIILLISLLLKHYL
jgi:hypothetical protein